MRSVHRSPIKRKLVTATLATTGMALLVAGVGIIGVDALLYRQSLEHDLTLLARVIAENSTAALSFNDPAAATQILGALRARPHVTAACIYGLPTQQDSQAFAHYSVDHDFSCPALRDLPSWAARQRTLHEPVVLNNQTVGTIVLVYDLGELPVRMRRYGSIIFVVFAVAIIAAFLLSARLRSSILEPIYHLVHATTTVSETGDYSVRAQARSDDELGLLVDRFNDMLTRIQARDYEVRAALQQVEDERARFAFLAESMPQKIFSATPQGSIEYCNAQWTEYAGLPAAQIQGWQWTQTLHPDDVGPTVDAWKRCLLSGQPFAAQQRFRRADGAYRWHLSRATAMRDLAGAITMWIGSHTDIHEQKETEEELRRANHDLQQFAYSASHDLLEPIRNVAIYSDLISRRYKDKLDGDAGQYLEFLREGAHRLSALVTDLLAYTRASMAELEDQEVDANAALRKALEALTGPIEENHAQITLGTLPSVSVGEVHLQQVFQNLIGNAIKYRSEQPPRIEVSCTVTEGTASFAVTDNGIGIDPEYKEVIFGVFKRLSHDRKLSGTGIGLAICYRIIDRYGGKIWVESQSGRGATFRFTIPVHQYRLAAVPSADS